MTKYRLPATAILLAALTAGCGTLPSASTAPETENLPAGTAEREVMSPASAALLEQSRSQQQSGNLAQAAATLERAVRIDPSEAAVWLELARLRYAEDNWGQAEQLARKAHSLAAEGSPVSADALTVMADALQRQGRSGEAQRLRERR